MADTIQAIASVANLVVIIIFFVVERKNLVSSLKNEHMEYWYRETVLKRGIDEVELCFGDLKKLIEMSGKQEITEPKIRTIILEMKSKIHAMKMAVIIYSQLFDKKLVKNLKKLMEDLEDWLMGDTEKNFMGRSNNEYMYGELASFKYKILKRLYLYDLQENI